MKRSRACLLAATLFPALLLIAPTASAAGIPSLGSLSSALDALFGAADKMVSTLVPTGQKLLALALVLELLYTVYLWFIKGSAADLIANLFRLMIVTSIPLAMLATWPELPRALTDSFTQGVTSLVTGSNSGASGQVGDMLDKIAKMSNGLIVPASGGFWHSAFHPVDSTLEGLTNVVVAIVMIFADVFFGLALLFGTFGPLVLLKVGLIMGPILVPLIVWKPTADIGMRWFGFMLTLCVAYVLGLVLAQLAVACMGAQIALVQAQSGTLDTVMVTLLGLIPTILAMVFCGFLLLKVEHIAAGMVGGPSIGGGAYVFAGALGAVARGGGGKGGDKKEPPKKDGGSSSGGGGGSGSGGGSGGSAPKNQSDLSKQAGNASGGSSGSGGGSSGSGGGGGGGESSGSVAGDGGGSSGSGGSGGSGAGGAASSPASAPASESPSDFLSYSASGAGSPAEGAQASEADAAGSGSTAAAGGDAGSGANPLGIPAESGAASPPVAEAAESGSRFGRFADTAKTVGKGAMHAADAFSKTGVGKASMFAVATVVGGPIAGAAVGAYAVSPKIRAGVGKAAGMTKDGAVKISEAVSKKLSSGDAAALTGKKKPSDPSGEA